MQVMGVWRGCKIFVKSGSPVLGRKKPKHKGHYVHKGGKGFILWALSFVTFVSFMVENSLPVQTVDPERFRGWVHYGAPGISSDGICYTYFIMRIYLDACCLNRPFDDQRQPRIRLEAEAISLILQNLHQREWEWIGSGKPSEMAGRGIEMTTETLTLYEIRTIGFEALLRELGPAGAIRFIQQYESGQGDYTRNRKKLLLKKSVRAIGKQIMKQRRSKSD